MSTIEKLSISLPTEMAAMLRERVAKGEYGSASEAIRDALRVWRDRKDRAGLEIETLRRLWQDGIASGPGRYASIEEIKAAARARRATT
jgi:antitoxin ParD1/3/4